MSEILPDLKPLISAPRLGCICCNILLNWHRVWLFTGRSFGRRCNWCPSVGCHSAVIGYWDSRRRVHKTDWQKYHHPHQEISGKWKPLELKKTLKYFTRKCSSLLFALLLKSRIILLVHFHIIIKHATFIYSTIWKPYLFLFEFLCVYAILSLILCSCSLRTFWLCVRFSRRLLMDKPVWRSRFVREKEKWLPTTNSLASLCW